MTGGAVRRIAIWLLIAALSAGVTAAQPRTEYEIKAAYLFTFGRFVEWPVTAQDGVFTICVLGVDPFGAVLDAVVEGGTLQGRPVAVRRLASASDAAPCRILFVSASEERQLASILQSLAGLDVLTVSDMASFVGRGGMIQFQTVGSRVRFEVDLAPARVARLMLSSELLRVASAVRQDGRVAP